MDALGLYGKTFEAAEVYDIVNRDRNFYDNSGGGVTFSGGEPTMQPDFLSELAGLCRQKGIHTALETNGCIREPVLRRVIPEIDLFLLDFKHWDPAAHKQYTGQDNVPVYRTLDILSELDKPVILRLPVIPTINDTPEYFKETRRLRDIHQNILKIETMPYHNHGIIKWDKLGLIYRLRNIPST
jgi:pyruvate formate lyase activating enzyme